MKYGDYDNVTKDVKALNDILARQGTSLLLDVIAEHVGKYRMAMPEFSLCIVQRRTKNEELK